MNIAVLISGGVDSAVVVHELVEQAQHDLQLCTRQMLNYDDLVPTFNGFLGLSAETSIIVLVVIELVCAVFIMLGFLTRLDCAQGIFHHVVPILLVQRHHLKRQAIAVRDEGTHLNVLLGTAIALVVVHPDTDIEQVQVLALLLEPVNHHSAIHASRYQYSNTQFLIL